MSFYNMVFGHHPFAGSILIVFGLKVDDFGRFRDVYLAEGKIAVYTRIGGPNRAFYQEAIDKLRQHPLYLEDRDDSFDYTYATFYFKYPEEFKEQLIKLENKEPFDPDARWLAAIEDVKLGRKL